jgi:2-haloacid dehalogenase
MRESDAASQECTQAKETPMIKAIVFDAYGTLYDVQSVATVIEDAFPGRGEYVTQIWRLKQLEYTWLRSMMGRYEDFWTVTRDALSYTLGTLGIEPDEKLFGTIAEAYNRLRPYPDAEQALAELSGLRLAILSNGSPGMLKSLVNDDIGQRLESLISVDAKRVYKPDPRAYVLVEETMGVPPAEVLFVSSNGFDVAGAKSFGFHVARIERVPAAQMKAEMEAARLIGPSSMFKVLRSQHESLGQAPDFVIPSLSKLPELVAGLNGGSTAMG